jgi:Periplasmic lysozyme inhibitor of I-type lysozyme
MRFPVIAMLLLFAASVDAVAQDRFVSKLRLPTGKTIVVAEGDLEARSMGSFSVRLYEAAAAEDETTFFISGLVHARDGVVEKVMLADVDGDQGQEEIVVIARSAGTGNYLSAQAFAVAGDKLSLRAAVEGLAADADPVAALRKSSKQQEYPAARQP